MKNRNAFKLITRANDLLNATCCREATADEKDDILHSVTWFIAELVNNRKKMRYKQMSKELVKLENKFEVIKQTQQQDAVSVN